MEILTLSVDTTFFKVKSTNTFCLHVSEVIFIKKTVKIFGESKQNYRLKLNSK